MERPVIFHPGSGLLLVLWSLRRKKIGNSVIQIQLPDRRRSEDAHGRAS